ncbi:MAG: MMPL family transporter [Eubacterium pyruvativorans]|uniref:efflux RND transporter permease subunit n=3 Tax=Eubacterium pyruvativorans TaxID=155865 RepID=UPI0023F13495|nr:MMPL family transporter [Eubacterium pyruvativorans]MCI5746731.1 MMPL family transporter [Eubacterium pyruvativorans]MDD6708486.1 MMPL family transporter [Eubacterium pyruvativorans]
MGFGSKVVKARYVILVIGLLLLVPSFFGMQATKINYDMLTYLPDSIETMKGQDMLLHDFGKGGFSIVVTENMKTDEVSHLKSEIGKVDHVDSVLNLQEVLNPAVPQSMYPDKVRENLKNPNASMIVVFFDTSTSSEESMNAVAQIRKLSTKDCFVSGMTAMVLDLKNLCETEESKYILVAVLLSLAVMMLLLDSFVVPFIFLVSIGMAILYNLGSNIVFGEISYVTKAIAAVLQLGVTMDYSIFLWHSYMEHLDRGISRKEAMGQAIDATLVSVTGSSITTVAGFLALCFMTYKMGMDLGLVMAKGCVFGVICSVTVLPSLILIFSGVLEKTRHRSLIPDCSKIAHGLTSRYGIYLVIFGLVFLPAIYGYMHENVTYDFTDMMGHDSGLKASQIQFMTANDKLEKDFDIGTTHMIIADRNLAPKDGRAMSEKLEDLSGVKNVLGVDALTGTAIPREFLPDQVTKSLYAKDHQLILVNSAYKVSTDNCNTQIDQINRVVHQYDKSAKVIGEGPATKDLIEITNHDFKVVNLISMAMVFLIILLVLRSVSLPFILIAAIEFAIYVNLGIPGFTGTKLPFIIPVCVSTIQLGSTVDYAILMSTRYKTERAAGKRKREAVEIASATSIPSILVSALGFFAATFGVGLYSNVGLISQLCNMMARGAIISMATVILVLPSLLMALDGLVIRSTKGLKQSASTGKTA